VSGCDGCTLGHIVQGGSKQTKRVGRRGMKIVCDGVKRPNLWNIGGKRNVGSRGVTAGVLPTVGEKGISIVLNREKKARNLICFDGTHTKENTTCH